MKSRLSRIIVQIVIVLWSATIVAEPRRDGPGGKLRLSGRPVHGQYVVVLRDDVPRRERPAVAAELAERHGARLNYVYGHVLNGFSARLPRAAATAMSHDPRVEYIEEDTALSITAEHSTPQTFSFFGIDRMDQRDLPLSETYVYTRRGSGVHVFVIDTGIRTTHKEFGTRANNFADFVGGPLNESHGTMVAGIVGARFKGVAKNAQIWSIRVCFNGSNCPGSFVIQGLDMIVGNTQLRPAVVNLSLGYALNQTGNLQAFEAAINRAIDNGITVVAGAGNGAVDAANITPARVPRVITVAASDKNDNRANYSNFGALVDLFAPGGRNDVPNQFIPTTGFVSDTESEGFIGTSAAAPHVAGLAALYLEFNPGATPAEVRNAIVFNATPGKINFAGANTPNLLAFTQFIPTPAFNPYLQPEFFVRQQYLDWLRRMPDPQGFSNWVAVMNQCPDVSCQDEKRVQLIRGFIESHEFTSANPILSNPPTLGHYNREYVRVLYVHALQRDPEQSGWDAWTNVLNQTGDRDIVVSGIVNSQEYASRFGEP
jgi:subtilisin family serine protease